MLKSINKVCRAENLVLPILEAGLIRTMSSMVEHHSTALKDLPSNATHQAGLFIALESLADLMNNLSHHKRKFRHDTMTFLSVGKLNVRDLDQTILTYCRHKPLFRCLANILVVQTRVKLMFPAMVVLWSCLSIDDVYDLALDEIVALSGQCAHRLAQLLETSILFVAQVLPALCNYIDMA